MRMMVVVTILGAALTLLGCSGGGGGQQRGLFTGAVTDRTEQEVEGKFGKPAAVDASNPNTVKWTYKRITFDPDNQNQVDNETVLIFQKSADGKLKVTQVLFN